MKPAFVLVATLATLSLPAARADAQEVGPSSAPFAPLPAAEPPVPPAPAPAPPAAAPETTLPPAPAAPAVTAAPSVTGDLAARSLDEGALSPGRVRVSAGLRVLYLQGGAFDAFARTSDLSSFALDGTLDLLHAGRFDVGVGLGWDVGTRGSGVRGLDASLTAHRFTVPVVGRWRATPWLEPFARVSPGAGLLLSSVDDPSAPSRLSGSAWAFVTDLSAGASVLVGPRDDLAKRRVRVWLTPEVGMSISTRPRLRLAPSRDDKDVLGSDAQADFGTMALTGFFWRASAAMTF